MTDTMLKNKCQPDDTHEARNKMQMNVVHKL